MSLMQLVSWIFLGVVMLVVLSAPLARFIHRLMYKLDHDWTNALIARWHRLNSRIERIARGGGGAQMREALSFIQMIELKTLRDDVERPWHHHRPRVLLAGAIHDEDEHGHKREHLEENDTLCGYIAY